MAATTFDYIICGGGTAGCALAARLKQGNPQSSIALIERGSSEVQHSPEVLAPLGFAKAPELGIAKIHDSVPQAALNGRSIGLWAGNMLSGSSGVNAGLWMRGDAKDYDYWAKLLGDERWSYKGLLPYFRRTEKWHDAAGSKELHGFDGPIKTLVGPGYPLKEQVRDAFVELGLKENTGREDGDQSGILAHCENFRPTRQPAGVVYDLSQVHVVDKAVVRRVIVEASEHAGPRATGVELVDGRSFRATKEVIISAGSYGTTQILMLSGIGARDQLDALGIPTVIESPDVGRNMWDHAACYTCWRLKPEAEAKGFAFGSPDFMSRPGALEGLPVDWEANEHLSSPELTKALQADGLAPDIVEGFGYAKRVTNWLSVVYMPIVTGPDYNVAVDGKVIGIGMLNYQPASRGTVTLRSADPLEPPDIDPMYLSAQYDRVLMRTAVRRTLLVAESKALAPYIDGEEVPAGYTVLNSKSSDAEIDDRIRKCLGTIYHPAGTAAMGKVVDSSLRVKGVRGLRVCDASVFPAPISATTQATVYAVAECLGDMLLREGVAAS